MQTSASGVQFFANPSFFKVNLKIRRLPLFGYGVRVDYGTRMGDLRPLDVLDSNFHQAQPIVTDWERQT